MNELSMTDRKQISTHTYSTKILLFCLSLLVCSCEIATVGPSISNLTPSIIQQRNNLGQLIIYRPTPIYSVERQPEIFIDGQMLGGGNKSEQCFHSGAIVINLPAGTYTISMHSSGMNSSDLTVNVENNKRVYVECNTDPDIFLFTPNTTLKLVATSIGDKDVLESESMILTGLYDLQ